MRRSAIAHGSTLETMQGRFVDLADPRPSQIDLTDIVVGLQNKCRFGGFVNRQFSILQHALLVRALVIEAGHPDLGLAALHHDSHEAYLLDIPTPEKRILGQPYRQLVWKMDEAIAEWLGIPAVLFDAPPIKRADLVALYLEASVLKTSRGRGMSYPEWPWDPDDAPTWPQSIEDPFALTGEDFYRAHHEGVASILVE